MEDNTQVEDNQQVEDNEQVDKTQVDDTNAETKEDNVEDNQKDEVKTYTQEEVDELLKQYQEPEVDEKEKELQDRASKLWEKEKSYELKENGLEDFAEFFVVDTDDSEGLKKQISKFKEIIGKRELDGGFVPDDHKSTDKYSLAEKNKDTVNMIGSKLSNLFK